MKPHLSLLRAFAFVCLAAAAHAVPLVYTATLSGANENPAVISAGTGWTEVTYDPDAHTLRIYVNFADLTGTTTVAHIHAPALPSGNASPATTTPTFPGFPAGVTSGAYDQTFDLTLASSYNAAFITNFGGGTVAGAEAALAGALADGMAYLNIHTTYAPGGEIRGNLAAVPDSTSAGLLLAPAFLVLLAARSWGRRR
jgi:hypothetical protein